MWTGIMCLRLGNEGGSSQHGNEHSTFHKTWDISLSVECLKKNSAPWSECVRQ
jgi:hypothetical protein